MNKYKVVATVQSEGNEPVSIPWSRACSSTDAMVCLGQILSEEENPPPYPGYSTKLLSIIIIPIPDPNDEAPWKV